MPENRGREFGLLMGPQIPVCLDFFGIYFTNLRFKLLFGCREGATCTGMLLKVELLYVHPPMQHLQVNVLLKKWQIK